MLLACLLCAPAAHAGGYTVSYSSTSGSPGGPPGGGSGGITAGGKLQPYIYASGQYDPASGGYYDYGASTSSYPASAGGTITATFTWAGNSPSDPPPPAVIITQSCSASGPGGAADNGLGSPTSNSGQQCVGVNYSANNSPGASFTVTCSPSASSTKGIIYVGYKAEVAPVMLTLTGPTASQVVTRPGDSGGSYSILVGQGCKAGLTSIPGGTDWPATTYKWSVSGTTFQDWSPASATNAQASSYSDGPGPLTNPTAHWYWNDLTSGTSETISCTATVTPPPGQGSAFPVTATQNVTVYVPTATHTNSVGVGYVGSAQSNNQTVTALFAAPTPAMRNNLKQYGSTWTTSVSLPTTPAFGSGQWAYAQLITPGEYLTGGDGVQVSSTDTKRGEGLDASFPYKVSSGDSGLYPTDGNSYNDGDSPSLAGLNVSVSSAKLTDSFRTYLMFQPPGSDIRWVPLAESLWVTNFNASIPPSGSWLDFPPNQSIGNVSYVYDFVPKNEFPKWTQIVQSNQPFTHN